ncbi:MAG: NAD(P)/FAD-dependent oxidoreductase [Candidatus Nealsonbacteria bacterium]|nr:NAD(P)/FAD-dependent oxidoreductase [Candidatus Nealsonbacteria bacterium]
METFETIIVGAGPGGLIAGRYLKNALILDAKKEIGKPIQCAEGLSKRGLEREGIKPDPAWISATIDTTQFILPNGKIISLYEKEQGYILDRVGFERFLASQSLAEIRLEKRVTEIERKDDLWEITTFEGEKFQAKYLIGADGPASIVRQKVFQEKIEFLPCLEYLMKTEKEVELSAMKMYFDKERFPFGYAWIFPKSKNTANIGLGCSGNLKAALDDFLENNVKKELGNCQILENKSGIVPWGGAKLNLFQDNAFLIGDAGALADPVWGGGINNAMVSGRVAAELILAGQGDSYEQEIKSMRFFRRDLLSAAEIFYSLDNYVLNEIGEILEKRGGDAFYLKRIWAFLDLLAKPNLRRNILNFFKLALYYRNYTTNA